MVYTLRQGAHLQWNEQLTSRAKYIAAVLAGLLVIFWGLELWYAGSHHVQNPSKPGRGTQALDVSAPKPPQGQSSASTASPSVGSSGSPNVSNSSGAASSGLSGGGGSFFSAATGGYAPSSTSGLTGGMGGGTTSTSGGTTSSGSSGGSTSGTSGSGGSGSGSTTVTVPGTCLDALGKQILCTGTTTIDP